MSFLITRRDGFPEAKQMMLDQDGRSHAELRFLMVENRQV
jgi:hypothetical protein